jgi:SAM-dependent methyltransferase
LLPAGGRELAFKDQQVRESQEIQRLKQEFDWVYPLPNEDGVRLPKNARSASVSFPSDSWDNDELNEEGMGVWADIRLEAINSLLVSRKLSTIWEVGAGNGSVCIGLSKLGHETIAVEPLYGGAKYIANQGLVSFCSTLEELKLPNSSIEAIGVFDVLEHIEDPLAMLQEFSRVLGKDGLLFITVPAHQFLFSKYDSSIGHYRRYSVSELESSLTAASFDLVEARFLFSFLVPLAWLLRVLPEKLGVSSPASSRKSARTQFRIAQFFSPVFRAIVALEKILRPPFGLSIIAIARPRGNS